MGYLFPAAPADIQLIYPPPEGPTLPTTAAAYATWHAAVVEGQQITPQAGLL